MTPYQRIDYQELIKRFFQSHPIVALLGPRQCGKTTLARLFAQLFDAKFTTVFDLEDPTDLIKLSDPKLIFPNLDGLIIIDEIQCLPNLFSYLRTLVDAPLNSKQFLILGSASRDLIRQSSESLAGRIAYIEMTPFAATEVDNIDRLWLRGGFPRSYLAETEEISVDWRKNYIKTFLERDLPELGVTIPPQTIRRFWTMLSHYHGKIFNASEFARSFNISSPTVQKYLDILTGTFTIRSLAPWYENVKKRQIKAHKIYFRDSGILHALTGIKTKNELLLHPILGASWEGMAIEEIIRFHHKDSEECFFWGTHSGAELDLLLLQDGKKIGFEIKHTSTPKLTASMLTALETLNLDYMNIIFPGKGKWQLHERVTAVGFEDYLDQENHR